MPDLQIYLQRDVNMALSKKLTVLVWIVTVTVLFLVGLMRQVKIPLPEGMSFHFLPPIHAFLNCIAAFSLIMAIISIKKGNVKIHQRWIYSAMSCSLLFLLSYVAYHFTSSETLFGDLNKDGIVSPEEIENAGFMRIIYLIILITHIFLAAVSLPFILLTFVYGLTNQFNKHRKLARRIFPIWLYVAVTGPVVYFLLMPYY